MSKSRRDPTTVQDGSKLRFECRGRTKDVVRVPVRVARTFRGSRLEADDGLGGEGTLLMNIRVEGRSILPEDARLPTFCFSQRAKNNLLSMPTCAAGGTISIDVQFLKPCTWRGTLRQKSRTDAKYVDGPLLLEDLDLPPPWDLNQPTLVAYALVLRHAWLNRSDEEAQATVHAFERRNAESLERHWRRWRDDDAYRDGIRDSLQDDPGLRLLKAKRGAR